MTEPHPGTFRLFGPTGEVIMTGSMSAIMERLPDTKARKAALDDMLKIACDAVEAEERADEARASVARSLCDGLTRLSARIDSFEKRLSLAAKRAEAARIAEGQRRVQQYLDALPDPEEPETDEEGDLPTELQKDTPPSLGTDPVASPAELGGPKDPKQFPQPISISLNEAQP
jgi:hypothetical protein